MMVQPFPDENICRFYYYKGCKITDAFETVHYSKHFKEKTEIL